MRVWLFYAHPKDVYVNEEDIIEWEKSHDDNLLILYAMTPDKSMAKEFRNARNMELFTEEVEDMTEEAWHHLSRNNRDCYLERYTLRTAKWSKDKTEPQVMATISMVMSMNEVIDIDDSKDIQSVCVENFGQLVTPIGIFDTKTLKVMKKLKYWFVMNMCMPEDFSDQVTDLCTPTTLDLQMMEISFAEDEQVRKVDRSVIYVDELELFIKRFGHTLAH